jgi:hypothetical protein
MPVIPAVKWFTRLSHDLAESGYAKSNNSPEKNVDKNKSQQKRRKSKTDWKES